MSGAPHRTQAGGGGAVAAVERQRRAQPSGWWATVLLIASETCLFGCLIASYFYLRFRADTWPPQGIEKPAVALPLAFTAMLIATAVPLFFAVRAAKAGRGRRAWWLILLATAVQATYLGLQIHLFVADLDRFGPSTSAYASIYFALLGVHHAHVAVGIAIGVFLLARTLSGLTTYRLNGIRILALYWYFVIAMAVLVVLTQLYPSL